MNAAQRKAAKRASRPLYMTPMKLVDPSTGEEIGAFVPAHAIDQRLAKERKYRIGVEYRCEIKQKRNPKFHRLLHAIGALLVDNVDGFEGLDAHDAIKRVQRESGVCCEEVEIDIPGMDKLLAKQAESLAFDDMDADRFETLFNGVTDYIDKHYAPNLLDDVRAEYHLMVEGGQG